MYIVDPDKPLTRDSAALAKSRKDASKEDAL